MSNPLLRRIGSAIGGPVVAIVLASVIISMTTPRFLDTQNLLNVSLEVSIVAVLAIGSTMAILTGGIDLSPGSMIALLTMCMGMFLKFDRQPVPQAVIETILLGALFGLANGVLIAYVRITPFIVTLATMYIFKGWSFLYNLGSPIFAISTNLEPVFYGTLLRVPLPFYYVLICYALAYIFLRYTPQGRAIYAVGGNETAARLSGINVQRTRMLAYTIAGAMAGIASVLEAARLNSGSPNYGAGMELQAIGAAVIGGASLAGGIGNIISTLLGALTVVVVQNGLNLNAAPTSWQQISVGAIILLAVGIDAWRGNLGDIAARFFRRQLPPPAEAQPTGGPAPGAPLPKGAG